MLDAISVRTPVSAPMNREPSDAQVLRVNQTDLITLAMGTKLTTLGPDPGVAGAAATCLYVVLAD